MYTKHQRPSRSNPGIQRRKTVKRTSGVDVLQRSDRKDRLSECVEMLHQIFQSVDLFSRQALRDFGVSGPQIWALRTIGEAGILSMGDLAQHMHLHMSTVTGIIDRLETSKLVTRDRSTEDARVMELRLTPKGRGILAKAPEPPRSKAARGLQKLGPKQLKQVHSALRLVAEAMDVDLTPPGSQD
jgi:MarR family transcriptional regulator, organic hydroperoxide resistance regulator